MKSNSTEQKSMKWAGMEDLNLSTAGFRRAISKSLILE